MEASPTLNGIDYMEVLDRDVPEGLRQRILLVYCFNAVGLPDLTGENVRIDGGVRVKDIVVLWAFQATAIPDPLADQLKTNARMQSVLTNANVLVVRVNPVGDFSTYKLTLVKSPTDPEPPKGFDLQFSEVEFSFKVECPRDFDCKSIEICPPEKLQEPMINYMAKDYASFRRLMLDRLATIMPNWMERNPADMYMALVEVLAYVGDQLSYYQDAVATEAYLGTARKRISVHRHARLLDYLMHDGVNARVWIWLMVDKSFTLEKGAPLLTGIKAPRGALKWDALPSKQIAGTTWFETMYDVDLRAEHNIIYFYTWGDEQCCLPKGATRATLRNDGDQLALQRGDVLVFEERIDSTNEGQSFDQTHHHGVPFRRHAVRLVDISATKKDEMFDVPVVDVAWHEDDALPFAMDLSRAHALGNIVLADHGRTYHDEKLEAVPDEDIYYPSLQNKDITHRASSDLEKDGNEISARSLMTQDPRMALPAVALEGDGGEWEPVRDLMSSDRFATEFVVEVEDDNRAYIRFGDDVNGRRPRAYAQLKANYRVGNGRGGNIGAEAITHVITDKNGIKDVCNPLPAQGGMDPEPIEQVRLYAPQAFRAQERAVTEEDYADVAQRYDEVQKAVATLRWTGSWHTIFITVDRKGGKPVDQGFKESLHAFLESFRLAGRDVEVEGPHFVPLDIAFTVHVARGYFRDAVRAELLEIFSNKDLPDGRRGFFHPDNFTFGKPVYKSKVVAEIMNAAGVVWVDADERPPKPNRFHRWGQPSRRELADDRISIGRLEVARLDNDPNAPENGKIEFYMEGGL